MKHRCLMAAAVVAVGLAGCSGSITQKSAAKAAPSAPPLKIAGVAFRGQSRSQITAALDKLGLYPARTNPAYWCDFWAQGTATAKFPGLGHVMVCYTTHGRWAETELEYGNTDESLLEALPGAKRPAAGWSLMMIHGLSHAPTFSGLARAIAGEYGKPSDTFGESIGPKFSSWITTAGNIIVARTFPGQHVTLTLTDPAAFRVWKAQMKAQHVQQQNAANPLGG